LLNQNSSVPVQDNFVEIAGNFEKALYSSRIDHSKTKEETTSLQKADTTASNQNQIYEKGRWSPLSDSQIKKLSSFLEEEAPCIKVHPNSIPQLETKKDLLAGYLSSKTKDTARNIKTVMIKFKLGEDQRTKRLAAFLSKEENFTPQEITFIFLEIIKKAREKNVALLQQALEYEDSIIWTQ